MKKFFYVMGLCLCLFAGAAVMTSCGDDEEEVVENGGDNGGDNGGNNTAAASFVEMDFKFIVSGVLYTIANWEISYEAGNEKNTVKQDIWTWFKTVKVGLPCTIKFARTCSVSPNYADVYVADHLIDYQIGYEGSYKLLDADGKTIEGSEKTFGETLSSVTDEPGNITAEKINQGELNSEVIFKFDKDGNLVK